MSEKLTHLTVILCRSRGFCAGVVRAVDIVEKALQAYGPPVYVRHEIVHNKLVVERLRGMGAIFVDDVDEIPRGALTVFSAHGVSESVENAARARCLDVIDATCPLVKKVHKEGNRYVSRGYDVILVGHKDHAEIEGTIGQINGTVHLVSSREEVDSLAVANEERVAYITQTTLSVIDTKDIIAALRERFPKIVGPDTRDICFATQNRQSAVLQISQRVDALIVIGSENSSNSNRLKEIGFKAGIPSYLVDDPEAIEPAWLHNAESVGLTAGASAPEDLVQGAIRRLAALREINIETVDGAEEKIEFPLPKRIREIEAALA